MVLPQSKAEREAVSVVSSYHHKLSGFQGAFFEWYYPYHPCIVYFPTFLIKINHSCRFPSSPMDGMGYEFLGNWWPQICTHGYPEILTLEPVTGEVVQEWDNESAWGTIQGFWSNSRELRMQNVYIHLGRLSFSHSGCFTVTFWKKNMTLMGRRKEAKGFGNSWELWFSPTLICLYNVPYFVVDSKISACQSF